MLVAPPIAIDQMMLGVAYLVFAPSLVTTPYAGRLVRRHGVAKTVVAALSLAVIGLSLLVLPRLAPVLLGMVLVGIGTFLAQAAATGFVGRRAMGDRAAASGLYLAAYYSGGLAGAFVLGQVFDRLGWEASVIAIGLALGCAAVFARHLSLR